MNKLYKTLIYDNEVSLSVLETTDLVNDAIKIHNLDENSAKTLGGLLTCCAYMSGCLKSERGAVSLTVKGDGEAGSVSVSGDMNLHIRGYINGSCGGKLKGGSLTVIKDDGFFRPFVGACELLGDDVSENLMQYFDKSEQIPTAVAIGVNIRDGKCTAAGGVVMQLLPGTKDENMDKAEQRMQAFVHAADVVEKYGADGILKEFFHGIVKEEQLYLLFPEYKCNCSRKKIEGVILPLGKAELLKICKEEGSVKVHCHYCNTDYVFTEKDVEELIK
ncbi:MAG: Hsp33 family molecular chaperone HslO [Clostridia bacterium]|nr:Hsp33 family molecular chaperone HslO [Clostridia bacterium]